MSNAMAVVICGLLALSTLALAGGGAPEYLRAGRPRLDMDGQWDFRMDPADEGVAGGWSGADVPFPDRIVVPGNWQAQGFGEPRRQLRHDYQGRAWYRRSVQIPADWAGKRIWLHLGGVTNTAELYANGRHVGSVDGFLTPYEFDLTSIAAPGETAVIACQVDSAGPGPVGMFNFFGHWGGRYRHVWLEARADPAIDDLFVMPDIRNAIARARVTLRRAEAGPAWQGRARVAITPVTGGQPSVAQAPIAFAEGATESDPIVVPAPVADMHLWSPEDPFLYFVDASLLVGDATVDSVRDRCGMRQLETGPGGTLLLNGRPYFVRGLGDDCVEVLTGTAAADKQVYLDRIRQCKRYGFNGFRYLAHTPAQEIFDAADEAGFLIMAEGEIYWRGKENIPLLKRQVEWIARAYRNHPSWYIWSSGNELFDCQGSSPDPEWMDYIQVAHDTFKRLDPTRFFVASDGADVFPTDIITQAAKFAPAAALYDQPFDGAVDEVAYFRRALSDDEMARLAEPAADYGERVRGLTPSGYWPLDETAVGAVADASGNGHRGRHESGVRPEDPGQPGVSGACLATGAGGRCVSLTDVAPAACAAGAEPFSLSLWIRPAGFRRNDWGTPFSCGSAQDGAAFLLSLDGQAADGHLTIGKWMNNVLTSNARLVAGQWNHVGGTYDATTLRLFMGGKPDAATQVRLGVAPVDARIGDLIRGGQADLSRYQELPHIWHEFPNTYIGPLADMNVDAGYAGVFRDDACMSRHREQISELGLTARYPEIRRRSVAQFYEYLKDSYESARHSPTMDGYAYWLMTDLPGGVEGDMNSCGILDALYRPEKFPDPAPILRFNRETVLLVDADSSQRVVAAGSRRDVAQSVSHYGTEPIKDGVVEWELKGEGLPTSRGTIRVPLLTVGQVAQVGAIPLGPWEPAAATKVTLSARLESAACRQENAWDFWVFPARKRDFTGSGVVNLTGVNELTDRYAAASTGLPGARLALSETLTPQLLDYLAAGGAVVLLTESGGLKRPLPFTYWPAWIRRLGNYIEDHPAVAAFPNDGFCAFQFIRLFGGELATVDLTAAGTPEREKLAPIIWGLKADYDPALGLSWGDPNNRWKHYRAGLVCEGRIGTGRLLICTLRVVEGVKRGWPEAGYLLDCLVDYALSDAPRPATGAMSAQEAAEVFSNSGGPPT